MRMCMAAATRCIHTQHCFEASGLPGRHRLMRLAVLVGFAFLWTDPCLLLLLMPLLLCVLHSPAGIGARTGEWRLAGGGSWLCLAGSGQQRAQPAAGSCLALGCLQCQLWQMPSAEVWPRVYSIALHRLRLRHSSVKLPSSCVFVANPLLSATRPSSLSALRAACRPQVHPHAAHPR